jgi:predicted alpha/beta superfamily hydrolase
MKFRRQSSRNKMFNPSLNEESQSLILLQCITSAKSCYIQIQEMMMMIRRGEEEKDRKLLEHRRVQTAAQTVQEDRQTDRQTAT